MFDLAWDRALTGPDSLAERIADIIPSNVDTAHDVLLGIAQDTAEPIERRRAALFIYFGCSDDEAIEAIEEGDDALARELLSAWYESFLRRHAGGLGPDAEGLSVDGDEPVPGTGSVS